MLRRIDPATGANLSFTQFVGPDNWDFEATVPASETELFHLDTDPFQLHNAYGTTTPALRRNVEASLSKLYTCRGSSCN